MSGRTEVDLHDVLEGLDAMQRRGGDLRPVFRELRPVLAQDLKDHFSAREAPEGAWSPWSASYLDRVLQGKGMRLKSKKRRFGELPGALTKRGARKLGNMLGKLKTAWKFTVDKAALEAKSIVPWASIHQEGGIAGHGAQIPARVFAWASDSTIARLVTAARDHLIAGWEKK